MRLHADNKRCTPGPQAHPCAAGPELDWIVDSAEKLPLPDASCDSYTVAFGIRNVTDRAAALREAVRVLKPGGRFMCLEFSQVDTPVLKELYDAYSVNVIPKIGKIIADDGDSYQCAAHVSSLGWSRASFAKHSWRAHRYRWGDRSGAQHTKGLAHLLEGWRGLQRVVQAAS